MALGNIAERSIEEITEEIREAARKYNVSFRRSFFGDSKYMSEKKTLTGTFDISTMKLIPSSNRITRTIYTGGGDVTLFYTLPDENIFYRFDAGRNKDYAEEVREILRRHDAKPI